MSATAPQPATTAAVKPEAVQWQVFPWQPENSRSTAANRGGSPTVQLWTKQDGAAVGHIFSRCFLCFFVGLKFGKKPVLACIISKSMFETLWCSLFSLDVLRDLPKFTSVAVVTVLVNHKNRTHDSDHNIFSAHTSHNKHCAWYQDNLMIIRTSVPLHTQGDGSVHSSKYKALPKQSSFTTTCKCKYTGKKIVFTWFRYIIYIDLLVLHPTVPQTSR